MSKQYISTYTFTGTFPMTVTFTRPPSTVDEAPSILHGRLSRAIWCWDDMPAGVDFTWDSKIVEQPAQATATAGDITVEDADDLLTMADQFLEDWEADDGKCSAEIDDCLEHRGRWTVMRPRLIAALKLVHTIARFERTDGIPGDDDDRTDGEIAEDSIATVNRLIDEARKITTT